MFIVFPLFSCLLFFPDNSSNDYIITSNSYKSKKEEEELIAATKIYSFEDGAFIKYISNTHKLSVYYLLPWFNKKNKKYYVIQFCKKKILINDLFEDIRKIKNIMLFNFVKKKY